jgi:N-acetylglutamate synthase-like GNAT family acetyltransferase
MIEEEQDQSEAPVVKRVMMQASRIKARLLRNNRGTFYTMDKKRIIRAGLEAEGASDTIGMVTITITPEMVGMEIGVPLVAEIKKPGWEESKQKLTPTEIKQENFIYQVNRRGGIGFFIDDHTKLEEKIAERLKIMVDSNIQRVKSLFDKVGQDQL